MSDTASEARAIGQRFPTMAHQEPDLGKLMRGDPRSRTTYWLGKIIDKGRFSKKYLSSSGGCNSGHVLHSKARDCDIDSFCAILHAKPRETLVAG
jgi:hypothetical protein